MCGNHTCSGTECTAADKRHWPALSEGETWMTPITGRTYKALHMSNGDIGGWIWLCYSSMHYPPMGGRKKNKQLWCQSCSQMTACTARCPRQPPVRFFRSPSWRSIFSCPPRGCSPVYLSAKANYIAAVLCQSKPLYFPPHRHTRACTYTDAPRTHTQTNTCSSNSSWPRYKAWIMPFDLSVVKYIDVHTRNDYLQLRRIMRQVSERMKNDGLFTMGFLYWDWMWVDYKPVFIIWKMERPC